MGSHLHPDDLRALSRLGIDAVAGVTRLVESVHHTISRVPAPLGRAPAGRPRGITGLVYRSVHGVTRLVGGALDAALAALVPLLGGAAATRARPTPEREAVLAALNGVLGDYLADSGSSFAIPMRLRQGGQPLPLQADALAAALARPTGRLLLLVHGLCMNDLQWHRRATAETAAPARRTGDPWCALARGLGFTPLHLHYNSGRHISTNGGEFADLLEALVQRWPLPVQEIAIIGHSMGGLVARSACHHAQQRGRRWLPRLRTLVFLGTPHHGAPLERGGGWIDVLLGASPYSAPFARLGKLRSAGITDLRHGNLADEDWQGRDRFHRGDARRPLPLPAGVACFAVAASTGRRAGDLADRVLGDGLVPVASALGRHADAAKTLPLAPDAQFVAYGADHLDLLGDRRVLAQVRRWLAPAEAAA